MPLGTRVLGVGKMLLLLGALLATYVLFAVGWVLFGLASIRAHVFPLPISIAIVLGGIIGFQAALPPFAIPLAVAICSLGSDGHDDRLDSASIPQDRPHR